jgi:amidase
MAGRSERDERTWNIPFDPIPDFTTFCQGTDLTGYRLGIPRNTLDADPPGAITDAFSKACQTLVSAGAAVIDNADFPAADAFRQLNTQAKGIVRASEFARDIALYLSGLGANPHNLTCIADLIAFTRARAEEDFPARDIGKFLWAQAEGVDVRSERYRAMLAQEEFFGGDGGILAALERDALDALVLPPSHGVAGDLAAKMGFPILVVPMGFWPAGTRVQRGSGLVDVAPGMP